MANNRLYVIPGSHARRAAMLMLALLGYRPELRPEVEPRPSWRLGERLLPEPADV